MKSINMKNITTIIQFTLLAFASLNTKAQGDLQFNRAVVEEISITASSPGTLVDSIIVPAGKVLKITNISSYTFPWGETRRAGWRLKGFYIGDIVNAVDQAFWLPAGSYPVYAVFSNWGSSHYPLTSRLQYNGIEFNVVQ
jgi:hypothetical protein